MYCTVCGKLIDDTSTRCPYCQSEQIPLKQIQIQHYYDGQSKGKPTKLAQTFGRIVGKGIGIGINVGMDIGKGIKDGINNEMNKKLNK